MLRRTTAELVVLAGADEDLSSTVQRHLEHPYRIDGMGSADHVPISVISAHPLDDHGGQRIVAGALLHVTMWHPDGPVSVVGADLVETGETSREEVDVIWSLLRRERRGVLAGNLGFNPVRPLPAFTALASRLNIGHGTWVSQPDGRPTRGLLLHQLEGRGGGTYRPDGAEIHWARIT
jgi:hypothetical protein